MIWCASSPATAAAGAIRGAAIHGMSPRIWWTATSPRNSRGATTVTSRTECARHERDHGGGEQAVHRRNASEADHIRHGREADGGGRNPGEKRRPADPGRGRKLGDVIPAAAQEEEIHKI